MLGTIASVLAPGVVDTINKWVTHKFPDLEETKRKEMSAELQLQLAQIQVNSNEALHPSLFVAGWRPFIGWVCGLGIAGIAILFVCDALGVTAIPIDSQALSDGEDFILSLAIPLLGLGGFRTYEKFKGVARHNMRK